MISFLTSCENMYGDLILPTWIRPQGCFEASRGQHWIFQFDIKICVVPSLETFSKHQRLIRDWTLNFEPIEPKIAKFHLKLSKIEQNSSWEPFVIKLEFALQCQNKFLCINMFFTYENVSHKWKCFSQMKIFTISLINHLEQQQK